MAKMIPCVSLNLLFDLLSNSFWAADLIGDDVIWDTGEKFHLYIPVYTHKSPRAGSSCTEARSGSLEAGSVWL